LSTIELTFKKLFSDIEEGGRNQSNVEGAAGSDEPCMEQIPVELVPGSVSGCGELDTATIDCVDSISTTPMEVGQPTSLHQSMILLTSVELPLYVRDERLVKVLRSEGTRMPSVR